MDIIVCIYILCMWSAFPGDQISKNMQRGRLQNIILYIVSRVSERNYYKTINEHKKNKKKKKKHFHTYSLGHPAWLYVYRL